MYDNNTINSTIKTYLDTWYINNIKGKIYENKIVDTLFCNDREVHSGGGIEIYYKAYNRLDLNKAPILTCTNQNDAFTVNQKLINEKTIGNGALTYPIGLITADESVLAGLISTTTNYLYTNQFLFTISSSYFRSDYAFVGIIRTDGQFSSNGTVDTTRGVRGVLNLKSATQVIGTGTISDPYKVV